MNSHYRGQAIAKYVLPVATRLLLEQCISIGSPIEPLGKVVDLNMGQSPRGASYNTDGFGIPFIGGPADLGRKYPQTRRWTSEPTKVCQLGDIIICVRATIGKPRWSDGGYCLGRGVAGLRPKSGELNGRFLFRCLVNLEVELQSKGTGTTFKTVSKKHIEALPIPLPSLECQEQIADYLDWLEARSETHESVGDEPKLSTIFDEQRRIVARVEELAALIEEARELRVKAREEAEALLVSIKNEIFDEEFRSKWASVTLGEVADIGSGVTLGRRLSGPTIQLPYLRVANVQDGYLDLSEVKEIEIRESEREKWLLQPGDILLTEGGDWDKLGRGTVWRGEIPNCIHQNHIFRVRVSPGEFDPEYLSALISSSYGKTYFQGASKQTTNLATINKRQLKGFVVFRPPLSEQRNIVVYLHSLQTQLDELTATQDATQAELDALLPSVLDRAFRGEL